MRAYRNLAMAMYSRAMAKLRGVIGDQSPTLLSSQNRNRGMRAFYQVRIGTDTRPEWYAAGRNGDPLTDSQLLAAEGVDRIHGTD